MFAKHSFIEGFLTIKLSAFFASENALLHQGSMDFAKHGLILTVNFTLWSTVL